MANLTTNCVQTMKLLQLGIPKEALDYSKGPLGDLWTPIVKDSMYQSCFSIAALFNLLKPIKTNTLTFYPAIDIRNFLYVGVFVNSDDPNWTMFQHKDEDLIECLITMLEYQYNNKQQ